MVCCAWITHRDSVAFGGVSALGKRRCGVPADDAGLVGESHDL